MIFNVLHNKEMKSLGTTFTNQFNLAKIIIKILLFCKHKLIGHCFPFTVVASVKATKLFLVDQLLLEPW